MKLTKLFLKNTIDTKEYTKNGDAFSYFGASSQFHITKSTKVRKDFNNKMKTKMLISSFEYSFILLYINLAPKILL